MSIPSTMRTLEFISINDQLHDHPALARVHHHDYHCDHDLDHHHCCLVSCKYVMISGWLKRILYRHNSPLTLFTLKECKHHWGRESRLVTCVQTISYSGFTPPRILNMRWPQNNFTCCFALQDSGLSTVLTMP